MATFLRSVYGELMKVTFPKRHEVIRMTAIVVTVSVIVGIYLGGLDALFLKMLELLVK